VDGIDLPATGLPKVVTPEKIGGVALFAALDLG
jgi:hypothetical protein